MIRYIGFLVTLAALVLPATAMSASDYAVLLGDRTAISDGEPKQVRYFLLPKKTVRGGSLSKRALINYTADGISFAYNEIYLNPETETCFPSDGDPIAPDSLTRIPARTIGDVRVSEATLAHTVSFDSRRLQRGIACSANVECAQSGLCENGKCRNRLLVCTRGETGSLQGNQDDFGIADVILHYRVN